MRTRLPKSKIVVFSVFPRKAGLGNEKAKEVNAILPEISDGKYISHIDLNAFFLNENGQQNKGLYNRDLLYLNDRGYLSWGRALYPLLRKYGLSVNPIVDGRNDY